MVAALLSSCDRRQTVGRRNDAILLLLVRPGLRSREVAWIGLDDVKWRAGELLVHGKGGRHDLPPLPVDVGEALVSYLRHQPRGPGGCRTLFLTVMPPVGPMSRTAVSAVVRSTCRRAGIERVSAHRLRPKELLGAAHAGCFPMSLSSLLEDAGYQVHAVSTDATFTMAALAEQAKATCPVSRLFASAEITMTATLDSIPS